MDISTVQVSIEFIVDICARKDRDSNTAVIGSIKWDIKIESFIRYQGTDFLIC